MTSAGFDDLIRANKRYSNAFPHGFDGIAHEGVLILTCMDSRLEPLEMFGLRVGEAKILRTPGGRLTHAALAGCVLGVLKLNVNRILVVPHTHCAAASMTEEELHASLRESTGVDPGDFHFGADPDQIARLCEDVAAIGGHRLIAGRALVGGFLYDVETGLVTQIY